MSIGTDYACPANIIEQNVILSSASTVPLTSPLLQSINDKLTDVGIKTGSSKFKYQTIVASDNKNFNQGYWGAPVEVCTTESQMVYSEVNDVTLTYATLRFCIKECIIQVAGYEQLDENLIVFANRVLTDTTVRQMEKFGYLGYTGYAPLDKAKNLKGLKDLGTLKTGGTTTPIDPSNYSAICSYITEGINEVRAAPDNSLGNEYPKSVVDVHISSDIVDKINCSLVGNNAIPAFSVLQQGILSSVRNVYISDCIKNSIYFVNHEKVFAHHTGLLSQRDQAIPCTGGNMYEFYAGCISFGATGEKPVIYGENVLDFNAEAKKIKKTD